MKKQHNKSKTVWACIDFETNEKGEVTKNNITIHDEPPFKYYVAYVIDSTTVYTSEVSSNREIDCLAMIREVEEILSKCKGKTVKLISFNLIK